MLSLFKSIGITNLGRIGLSKPAHLFFRSKNPPPVALTVEKQTDDGAENEHKDGKVAVKQELDGCPFVSAGLA